MGDYCVPVSACSSFKASRMGCPPAFHSTTIRQTPRDSCASNAPAPTQHHDLVTRSAPAAPEPHESAAGSPACKAGSHPRKPPTAVRAGRPLGTLRRLCIRSCDHALDRETQAAEVAKPGRFELHFHGRDADEIVTSLHQLTARFQRARHGRDRRPELGIEALSKGLKLVASQAPHVPTIHRPVRRRIAQCGPTTEGLGPSIRIGVMVINENAVSVQSNDRSHGVPLDDWRESGIRIPPPLPSFKFPNSGIQLAEAFGQSRSEARHPCFLR